MAKKKAIPKKAVRKTPRPKKQRLGTKAAESTYDTGPLDAPRYVIWAGEMALGLVEYRPASVTQTVQDFAVHVQEVSARPNTPYHSTDNARYVARELFEANDHREPPFLRIIGRVLDELLNHREDEDDRRYASCSAGDVYMLMMKEIASQLPPAHRQSLPYDRTLNPGRKVINNRLRDLKGKSREDGKGKGPACVATTLTTAGGAEQGYILTEVGQWLFEGWPELPELIPGRSRGTL